MIKDKNEFVLKLKNLINFKIPSKSGSAYYHIVEISSNKIHFTRNDKAEVKTIRINKLYEFFTKEDDLESTVVAKKYVAGKQSPSVAILLQLAKD